MKKNKNKKKLLIILLIILLIFSVFNIIKKINNKNKIIIKKEINFKEVEKEINNAYKMTNILSGKEQEQEMINATAKSLSVWELFVGEYKDNQPIEYKKTKNWEKKMTEILRHERKADELIKEKNFIMATKEIDKSKKIFKKIKQENEILDISEEMIAFYKSAQKILDANTKKEVENNLLGLKYNFTVLKEYNIGGSGEWYNLDEGDNKIRIISTMEVLAKHFDPASKKSFVCFGKNAGCPWCKQENKPQIKFMMYVIDRKDEIIKIASFGYKIISAIEGYKNNKEYAFDVLPEYDITITKTKTGSEAKDVEYSVIPARSNTSLTEEEEKEIEKVMKNPIAGIVEKMKEKEFKISGVVVEETIAGFVE